MAFPSRNPFIKLACQKCGWSLVTYEPGDVIFGPTACQKCGSEKLKRSKANPVESALAFPVEFARHLLK